MFDQRFCIGVTVTASWSIGVHDFVVNSVTLKALGIGKQTRLVQRFQRKRRRGPVTQGAPLRGDPGLWNVTASR